MRFDKDGYLIVVDAYLGMYKINVASRECLTCVIFILALDQYCFLNCSALVM